MICPAALFRLLIAAAVALPAVAMADGGTTADKACFTASALGQNVRVDATCASLKQADYRWDFGDGESGRGLKLDHDYAKPGDYTIRLQIYAGKIDVRTEGRISISENPELRQLARKKLTPEQRHVTNPYAGADIYINPDYAAEVNSSLSKVQDRTLAGRIRSVAYTPTAIWMDRIDAIAGGDRNNGRAGLESHLLQAMAQQVPGKPMVVELVIYNLPDRDCAALSSNGTLSFEHGGLDLYKHSYIDVIDELLSDPRFASLRFVIIIEPDSLPNMITNLWHPACKKVHSKYIYDQGIEYAIQRFSRHPNNYLYLDIAHAGWLGWDEPMASAVSYYTAVVKAAGSPRKLQAIDGFVTDISNFTPARETLLTDPEQVVGGQPVKSASFYGWNSRLDEKHYVEALYEHFVKAGFSTGIRFLIDTSRNGWGGKKRPTTPSNATELNNYVDQTRLDRRIHRGNWCNQRGAGIGFRPAIEPYGANHPVAAFVWVKPPGESDGISDPGKKQADAEGKRYDPMCDPNYVVSKGQNPSNKPTGAMPHAPAAGHWFHDQFIMLINNAWPSLDSENSRAEESLPRIPGRTSLTFGTPPH